MHNSLASLPLHWSSILASLLGLVVKEIKDCEYCSRILSEILVNLEDQVALPGLLSLSVRKTTSPLPYCTTDCVANVLTGTPWVGNFLNVSFCIHL